MKPLRIKNSYIPWSFPELVAKEEGIFERNGLDVSFYTLPPEQVEPGNKISWYSGLVEEGKVDAYSCCAWAALDRLSDGGKNKIVGATSSLNYAFSIMVQPDSKIDRVSDLADTEVLVNLRTGSHYCNLRQLEEYIPFEKIKLVHGGAPQSRLLSLLQGAPAASLISPYTEVAEKLGFKKVFETGMVDVLAYISKTQLSEAEISSFLESVEEAIRVVNADPMKFKPLYVRILNETFSGYPDALRQRTLAASKSAEGSFGVVQWGDLKPYSEETFSTIKNWMTSHSLLEKQVSYEQLVNNAPLEKALASAAQ
ncbi:MAG TPA: hypothetical protein VEJ36_00385 [Nitrososphaerales archaeon]|nr:hypothetical protein [Nitrososphaerales archaeon]